MNRVRKNICIHIYVNNSFNIVRYLYLNGVRNFLLADHDVTRRRSVEWIRQAANLDDSQIHIEYANVAEYPY